MTAIGGDFSNYWVYDENADTFVQTKDTTVGIGSNIQGSYAFVTAFTYDYEDASSQILSGLISLLGTNLEILINGVLLDEQYFNLSPDQLTSTWFEGYYLDISLDSLFADHLLVNGDNNIAFVIDTLAAEPKLPLHVADIGLVAFAADIGTGSRSTTPEPATMLIFGLGLVGLGLRRKLIRKMK